MVDSDRVIGKVKELGGAAQATFGDTIYVPGDSAEGRFRKAEGSVGDLFDQVNDVAADLRATAAPSARQRATVARAHIGAHPLTALILAGAAGYALSLLINARR